MRPDQTAAKPSENLREPTTMIPRIVSKRVMERIEYLKSSRRLTREYSVRDSNNNRVKQDDPRNLPQRPYHHPAINLRDDPPQRDSAR